jgi:hypothetical protein
MSAPRHRSSPAWRWWLTRVLAVLTRRERETAQHRDSALKGLSPTERQTVARHRAERARKVKRAS